MEEENTIKEAGHEGLDRREFALRSIMAMLSGVVITISGCGGGSSSPTQPNPQPSSGDKTGTISANHGHIATITAARLSAGGELTLDLRGDADHPHSLQLTAAEVASIAAGTRVGKASSEDASHTHTVTFN